MARATRDDRVPVTVLTGFLGAGKTSLVDRIVRDPDAGPVAVVVNEFAEVPVDGRLIPIADDQLVELSNGCICCTVRGDLAAAVRRLLDRRRSWLRRLRFERLLVEPSGLASPGPILQTFLLDPDLAARTRVDGVVALASAPDLAGLLAGQREAAEQLGYADVVLLNHVDRADPATIEAAEAAIRQINGTARVVRTVRAETPIAPLLDLRAADPGRWRILPALQATHTAGVRTLALYGDAPLDLHKLKLWLQFTAKDRSHRLLRLKGIVRCQGHDLPIVAHGVCEWLELGPGTGALPERSVMVLIGSDLDEERLRRGWDACAWTGDGLPGLR